MKSSAHHYGEGVGLVAVHGRDIGYDMGRAGMRKDLGWDGGVLLQGKWGGGAAD